mmetsp:Transcript_54516/g.150078  ORF Transcript_54516/g.150078 Transcript_54516/m.150078 type:complete len:276 (+) Transcript_54516:454-1281(+)
MTPASIEASDRSRPRLLRSSSVSSSSTDHSSVRMAISFDGRWCAVARVAIAVPSASLPFGVRLQRVKSILTTGHAMASEPGVSDAVIDAASLDAPSGPNAADWFAKHNRRSRWGPVRAASIRAMAAAPCGPRLLWLRSRSVKQFANGHRSVASSPKAAAPASSVAPPVLKPTNISVMMAMARWSILLRESTRLERQRALRIPMNSVLSSVEPSWLPATFSDASVSTNGGDPASSPSSEHGTELRWPRPSASTPLRQQSESTSLLIDEAARFEETR